ncbi:hypothetical protein P175DRAFT_020862 [Aspergillus ochraceoroseus IBT 24754]|uniref:Secreted protein n=1 Tax=Aspergillus ochraceoroseus IBT 24754 TaxID=1392256 RepID=A0A2T5M6H8_9EURO|nr:uncharacterized protein P175DRAFT_020862 [Aspergillus ochraceoroseus IBT 24754]PTU24132.1 hypothetical protein P175DRAFT_020862 [Aspergillus ochraceoroseus IBT 24754]
MVSLNFFQFCSLAALLRVNILATDTISRHDSKMVNPFHSRRNSWSRGNRRKQNRKKECQRYIVVVQSWYIHMCHTNSCYQMPKIAMTRFLIQRSNQVRKFVRSS